MLLTDDSEHTEDALDDGRPGTPLNNFVRHGQRITPCCDAMGYLVALRVGAENSTLASATCCTMCIERYGRGYHSTARACCLLRPSALLCRLRLCFAVLELTVLRFAVAAFARWFGAQFCCGPFAILSSRLSTIASCAAGNTLFCRNSLACSATAALRSADQR
jgi:hypothetical protein